MQNGNGNHHMRERERLDFSKIQSSIQIPNLIEVQKKSYQRFLQMDLLPFRARGWRAAIGVHFGVSRFRISAACRSWILWTIPSATGNASAAT